LLCRLAPIKAILFISEVTRALCRIENENGCLVGDRACYGSKRFCLVGFMAFTMKRAGIDFHALTGGAGFCASIVLSHWSEFAGGIAATATAAYMALRAVREWVKLRSELRAKEVADEMRRTHCTRENCKLREHENLD
jgi:hypothetical protein